MYIYIYDAYCPMMQQSCHIRSINIISYTLKTKHVCSIIKSSTSTSTSFSAHLDWDSGVPIPKTTHHATMVIQSPTPALPLIRFQRLAVLLFEGLSKAHWERLPKYIGKMQPGTYNDVVTFFAFSSSERYYIHII